MTPQTSRHSARTRCVLALTAGLVLLAAPMPAVAAPVEPAGEATPEPVEPTDPTEPTEPTDESEPDSPDPDGTDADSAVDVDEPVLDGTVWYLDPDGTELTGTNPTATIRFSVPPGWEPESDGSIEIPYSFEAAASGLLAVTLNGDYITGVTLDQEDTSARVAIPARRIRTGSNLLEITGAIDLTVDGDCKDPTHPARRMSLGADTRLIVPMQPDRSTSLTDFPEVLEPLGSADRIIDVHLVGDANGANLTAVAPIISAIRGAADQPVEISINIHDTGAALTAQRLSPTRPAIVIGTIDDVSASSAVRSSVKLPGDVTVDDGVGAVALGTSDEGAPVLVITGVTGDGTASAALTISDPGTRAQLDGANAVVADFDVPVAAAPGTDFTLESRGYPDRTLSGPGRDTTLYAFDVPLVSTPEAATIRLSAGRSSNAQDVLGVAVVVNGNRSGVVPFDENGLIDASALTIQRGVLRPGRNFIRFETDFVKAVSDCSKAAPQQSIEISASTRIELSGPAPRATVDLDDLPYIFRSDVDASQLRVVLPARPTPTDHMTALDLAVLLGSPDVPARIVDADELDPTELRDHHLVILGEPARQPLHDWLGLDVADEIASIAPDDIPDVDLDAVVTVHQNPASSDHVALIATGFDGAGAQRAADAILDVKLRGSLSGHTTGVGFDGTDTVFGTTRRALELQIVEPTDDGTVDVEGASAIVEESNDSAPGSSATSTTSSSLPSSDDASGTGSLITMAVAAVALLLLLIAAAIFFVRWRRDDTDADTTSFPAPDEGDDRDD